jgi:hypothetical protein
LLRKHQLLASFAVQAAQGEYHSPGHPVLFSAAYDSDLAYLLLTQGSEINFAYYVFPQYILQKRVITVSFAQSFSFDQIVRLPQL